MADEETKIVPTEAICTNPNVEHWLVGKGKANGLRCWFIADCWRCMEEGPVKAKHWEHEEVRRG